jgi:hypothetical protein
MLIYIVLNLQLEFVRREMELAEEAGDEDGFEDML